MPSSGPSERVLQQPCQGRADHRPDQGTWGNLEIVRRFPRGPVLLGYRICPSTPRSTQHMARLGRFYSLGSFSDCPQPGPARSVLPGERYLGVGPRCHSWPSATPEALASGTAGQINGATW